MKQPDISNAKDPDLRSAMAALVRAGVLARKTAMDTDTDLVFVKDGRLVYVDAKTTQSAPSAKSGLAK